MYLQCYYWVNAEDSFKTVIDKDSLQGSNTSKSDDYYNTFVLTKIGPNGTS